MTYITLQPLPYKKIEKNHFITRVLKSFWIVKLNPVTRIFKQKTVESYKLKGKVVGHFS